MVRERKYQAGKFKTKVKRSKTGLGLFAVELIPKNKCIIEYIGRTLSRKEEYTSKSKYLFAVNSKKTIDGASRKNIARYINHSCRPNSVIETWKKRVWVLSKKNIKPGEEITYDYDTEYWNEHIRPKGCKCFKCLETPSFK